MVHHPKYPFFTFDIFLEVKVTQNIAQYPLHHVIYAPAKFEVAIPNSLFDLWPWPRSRSYKMQFEVATPNGLWEDTITRNVTDELTCVWTNGRKADGAILVQY